MAFEKALASKLTFRSFKVEKETSYGLETVSGKTRDQIRPGTVVRYKDGVVQIIGHCNQLMGVCDDCVEYDIEAIVEIAHIEELTRAKKRKPKKRGKRT